MKTIKVTFAKRFTPGLDTVYTYKTESLGLVPGMLVDVETPDGLKLARLVEIDEVYDAAAEKRWGELKLAYGPGDVPKQDKPKGVHRL
jgi:hypothetical protein